MIQSERQLTSVYAEIAVDSPLHRTFTYHWHSDLTVGARVVVPFGRHNGEKLGLVLQVSKDKPKFRTKSILSTVDEEPIFSESLLRLAKWLSSYYFHPIGLVLKTMLPGSVSKKKTATIAPTELGLEEMTEGRLISQCLSYIYKNKKTLSRETFLKRLNQWSSSEAEVVTLDQLLGEQLVEVETIQKLSLRTQREKNGVADPKSSQPSPVTIEYTRGQRVALEALKTKRAQNRPFLLLGPTGSGKTEVYLSFIAHLFSLSESSQVLVMVPEISLTPQMSIVFEKRFPGMVAFVHSALEDSERWDRLAEVRRGNLRILIGPRSSVFAAFNSLSAIIVDEEHDSSYKQGSGLRYQGRDVAIVRGRYESIPVILGSATPSLESFQNARLDKYQLLQLTERANRLAMPEISILEHEVKPMISQNLGIALEETEVPIHPSILESLEENHKNGQQSMVIVNRRGFAYFLYSKQEKKAVSCRSCDVTMTLHKKREQLVCHYCDERVPLARVVGRNPNDFIAVGFGSEQVEEFLAQAIPSAKISRMDSDSTAKKGSLETLLSAFRNKKIDILVGTQMLAKGHDFEKVTLICLIEVDRMMSLPDFRAGERTFQLMVQAAGRAGRGSLPGRVLLQTGMKDNKVIKHAIRHDYKTFAEEELTFRRENFFPPFVKMLCFEFSSESHDQLSRYCLHLEVLLRRLFAENGEMVRQLQVHGPVPPPIEKVRKHWRRCLLMTSADVMGLRRFAELMNSELKKAPSSIKISIDIDPQTLI